MSLVAMAPALVAMTREDLQPPRPKPDPWLLAALVLTALRRPLRSS